MRLYMKTLIYFEYNEGNVKNKYYTFKNGDHDKARAGLTDEKT